MAFKKKLFVKPTGAAAVETHRTKNAVRIETGDARGRERAVRQLLADKVSGTLVGLFLLVPAHLRLGSWDLLRAWTGGDASAVEPRLALQLVHEAALAVTNVRQRRTLSQKGFELANGLPFVATDRAIHQLLASHTVAEAERLQVALGVVRRALGHFEGRLLAIDPHRMRSYSQRQMPRRCAKVGERPVKTAQAFFCLDADTHQPVAFTLGSAARTVAQATPGLLHLAADILGPDPGRTLALADTEHYSAALFAHVAEHTPFDLLVPMSLKPRQGSDLRTLSPDLFTARWAGLATARRPYRFTQHAPAYTQFLQRTGERPNDYHFKAFLCTADRDELAPLTADYPCRWHVEEFFNTDQALGWNRAGTLNLHIRYGALTLTLLAQAALHLTRQCLGDPFRSWSADHFANRLLAALDGDIRVLDDTILVTFYNTPNSDRLRPHFEGLPHLLQSQGINPHIPWLYNFKLDFRFR